MTRPPTDAPDTFEARLAAAKARNAPVDPVRLAGGAMGQGFRFAAEIVITTVVGSAIGWQLDRWLGSKPWLLLLLPESSQPVTPRRVTTSANVINAGRIHFDCVTAMIPLMSVLFIFITVFFILLCCVCFFAEG